MRWTLNRTNFLLNASDGSAGLNRRQGRQDAVSHLPPFVIALSQFFQIGIVETARLMDAPSELVEVVTESAQEGEGTSRILCNQDKRCE